MKVAESKGRFEVWSGPVWSAFLKTILAVGGRKEAVSRCGLEVAARQQLCDLLSQRPQSFYLGRGSNANLVCLLRGERHVRWRSPRPVEPPCQPCAGHFTFCPFTLHNSEDWCLFQRGHTVGVRLWQDSEGGTAGRDFHAGPPELSGVYIQEPSGPSPNARSDGHQESHFPFTCLTQLLFLPV